MWDIDSKVYDLLLSVFETTQQCNEITAGNVIHMFRVQKSLENNLCPIDMMHRHILNCNKQCVL